MLCMFPTGISEGVMQKLMQLKQAVVPGDLGKQCPGMQAAEIEW